jgi:methylenetetrahydrofolate dehydrogenase (NADP+) / methenyltetrahydrofolate cyclohydrolase
MAATIIDGKAVAQGLRAKVRDEVAVFTAETGRRPGLATVLVGNDPASAVYVGSKQKACAECGITGFDHRLPADTPQEELAALLDELNADDQVSGILLQLPVPPHIDGTQMTAKVDPDKDVDGLTPLSAGRLALGMAGLRPCTPEGVITLLDAYDVELKGAEAVVLGRSNLVGKPVAQLLLQRHATVTICHSRTRDLEAVCARADVLVAAVGQPKLVGPAHVKPGAAVIDVGTNRTEAGLVGDVDFEAVRDRAGLITPVPGGVGPMTIASLMANTLRAARLQAGLRSAA